jgi:hypothetical protein
MELLAFLIKAFAGSELVRGVTSEVTVGAAPDRVLALCREALETVVDGEAIRIDADRQRVTAIGFYTLKSATPIRFKLAIQLAKDGQTGTRVTVSSRPDWLGELGSTERRHGKVLDVGYWLKDHAAGEPSAG